MSLEEFLSKLCITGALTLAIKGAVAVAGHSVPWLIALLASALAVYCGPFALMFIQDGD